MPGLPQVLSGLIRSFIPSCLPSFFFPFLARVCAASIMPLLFMCPPVGCACYSCATLASLRSSALTGSPPRKPGATPGSECGGTDLGGAGGAPPSASSSLTGGGQGRSGANASADCSEPALKLASLWGRSSDAHSATVNARSTHGQRTVNARSTRDETCLRAPCFRHARVFKSFSSKKKSF